MWRGLCYGAGMTRVQEILGRLDELEANADEPMPFEQACQGAAEYLELEMELAALTGFPVGAPRSEN